MMNLDLVKEELRNKRGELLAGILAAGFSFATADASPLPGLSLIVAAGACGLLGGKDWSSGRKLVGGAFCAIALVIFLFGAGAALAGSECRKEANTEAAMEKCRDLDIAAATYIRRLSGITLLFLLANPLLGLGFRQRLQTPGTFAAQFGEREPAKAPNRWYSKENGFEAFILEELDNAGITGRRRYEWICDVRGVEPEQQDGGARYDWKARDLLTGAPWQTVYDLVERCWPVLGFLHRDHFERRVNEYLREVQVGWVFERGKWTRVGDEMAEANLQRAAHACKAVGAEDARSDMENAWKLCNELGEGYEKDAIGSATRALERIIQARMNQPSANLNRIKWEGPNVPHEKLRGVINTLYSYSSDQARHANEGAVISGKDAHFVVSVAAILIVYLAEESSPSNPDQTTPPQNEKEAEGAEDIRDEGAQQGKADP